MPISKRNTTLPTLAARIANMPQVHTNDFPLWKGPCASGTLGGITQSMLVRFMSCRERFRLKYVLGLEPLDRWNKNLGYGNFWHTCEEAHAKGTDWKLPLDLYASNDLAKYPFQREEITKWYNVCLIQFPEYVKHWASHPDVVNRTPLMQEQVFDVSYELPSGRVVRLRGKFDSVDLIDGGIWLQENKSKGDIDKQQVERQLKFDLQTMLYLLALIEDGEAEDHANHLSPYKPKVKGVRYNVVRRPLSGGIGNITQHKGKVTKATYSKKDNRVLKASKVTPAETDGQFYERLRRDYIAADPAYWFFRVRSEVSAKDIQVFRETCLDPLLEQLCWWYDEVTGAMVGKLASSLAYGFPPMSYRTPFGMFNPLMENGATEYDAYLENGSEAGLRRVESLFEELK